MSFGISPSDVVAGIRIAHWVYTHGFTEEKSKNVQLRNFRNEVKGLHDSLKQLEAALCNAAEQFQVKKHTRHDIYNPLASDFEKERKTLIGDFEKTLRECEALVKAERKTFRNVALEASQNVYFAVRIEPRVEELRKRLQAHTLKSTYIINRLSLQVMTDTAAQVEDIRALSEQTHVMGAETHLLIQQLYVNMMIAQNGQQPPSQLVLDDNHQPGPLLTKRFQAALAIDAPTQLHQRAYDTLHIPLAEGFDALLQILEQNQEDTSSSHTQTPEQYLVLLKARWLCNVLKSSHQYKAARPGYYYKRAVGQLEQRILLRVRTPGLLSYDEQELLSLSEVCLRIWPPTGPPPRRQARTDVRADEQKVLQLDLAPGDGGTETLYIFRSSEDFFRIVTARKEEGHTELIENMFNAVEDHMIPRYTMPTLIEPCCEISIFSRRTEYVYRFQNTSDLYRFQKALVGYEVNYPSTQVSLTFSKKSLNCRGLVQIWQEPVSLTSVVSIDPATSTSPTNKDLDLRTLSIQGSTSLQSGTALSFGTSTMTHLEDGLEAGPLPSSALTIFTYMKNEKNVKVLAIIFVQLIPGIYVTDYSNQSPLELFVEREDRAPFPVRVYYSQTDQYGEVDPNTWDILPFRLHSSKLANLKTKDTTYLTLEFEDLRSKSAFEIALRDRMELRDSYRRLQAEDEALLLRQAGKPKRVRTCSNAGDHRRTFSVSTQQNNLLFPTSVSESSTSSTSRHTTKYGEDYGVAAADTTCSVSHHEKVKLGSRMKKKFFG